MMRPTFALGLALGWRRVVAVFVVVVAILRAGTLVRGSAALPVAVTVAVLVVAVALLTWRGVTLLNLIGRHRKAVTKAVSKALPAAGEHELQWTQTSTAIRSVGYDLIAVVAVDGPSHIPSVLDHHRVQSAATLPVAVIADALRQFDVTLSGIDILSVGRRRASKAHHHYAATYSAIVGDHPAMGRRRTWCVLRMNSLDNLAAVACRESVAATLAACAQRLAVELSARHCAARVVDAAELADVDELLAAGVAGNLRPHWGGISHERGFATSYWVSPRDISTATLDRLWVPDTEYTATAIQLRPTPDGAASVGVLVRYGTGGRLTEPPLTGLNPLSGRHDLALRAGLADAAAPAIRAPHRPLEPDADLRAPIGSSGVIVGATTAGHPLLVDLGAAAPSASATITVAGELALLVQLALRAAATGYQVLVVSARPARWRQATAAGLRVLPQLPEQLPDDGRAVLIVCDEAQAQAPGPTAAVTMRAVAPNSASVADVHVEQDSPRTAVIRTADFQYRANIDVSAERNLIGTPPAGRAA
jgi:type VII secretion protein EccE